MADCRSWPEAAAWTVTCGGASFALGAAAALLVTGPARLAVWLAVTGVLAAAGGAAYGTRPVVALTAYLPRWIARR